jgi:hypothetical protein
MTAAAGAVHVVMSCVVLVRGGVRRVPCGCGWTGSARDCACVVRCRPGRFVSCVELCRVGVSWSMPVGLLCCWRLWIERDLVVVW